MRIKLLQLVLLLSFAVLIVGCGSGNNDSNSNGKDAKNMDEEKTSKLRVAGVTPEDHPNTIALEKFAEKVETETDGRIEMDVYPANQLGDYTLMYEEISNGSVEMGLISIPTEFDSRLEIDSTPYLFETYDQIRKNFKIDSKLGEILQGLHNESNVKLLGFFGEGFGGIGTTKEVKEPLNFDLDKDVSIRIPDRLSFKQMAEDLNFRTVSMQFSDLFTAMQTGQVDGWIGGHPAGNYVLFNDVIKYYYHYNLFFEATHLIINDDLWNEFSDEDRQIIQTAANELTEESINSIEEVDQEYLEKMRDAGIEVVEFSDEELKDIAEHIRENTWPILKERFGDEFYEEMLKLRK